MPEKDRVLLFGHAIVDELTFVTDEHVAALNRTKGSMTLVDAQEAQALRNSVQEVKRSSGGSAASTAAALAMLGAPVTFVGRVAGDELGKNFVEDIEQAGVRLLGGRQSTDKPTASCMVMVTPDGERTMSTHLGISAELSIDDFDLGTVKESALCYMEGYLWDSSSALSALSHVCSTAVESDTSLVLSLSDSGCVQRHREEFLALLGAQAKQDGPPQWTLEPVVSVVLGNEDEFAALIGERDPLVSLTELARHGVQVAMTLSERGSIVFSGDSEVAIAAEPVAKVVDATGAGDMYAAGFLYGLLCKATTDRCARLGSLAAASVLGQLGARPQSLEGLADRAGI